MAHLGIIMINSSLIIPVADRYYLSRVGRRYDRGRMANFQLKLSS